MKNTAKGKLIQMMTKEEIGMMKTKSVPVTRMSKDDYYLDIAIAVSRRSTCLKRHYGAVIVRDDMIIATGYNGAPRGELNCCDCGKCQRADAKRYEGYESCPAVHAEQNALIQANGHNMKGAVLYLACENMELTDTHKTMTEGREDKSPRPCGICEKMIKNAGIVKVVTRASEM